MSRFQWLALATACATLAVISPVSAAETLSLGTEEVCKFPFLYKGSWWNTCTSIGTEKPWCILKPENKPPPPANDWLTCDESLANITALVEGSQEQCVTRDVNGEKVFGCSSNDESGPFTCLTKSGKTGTCTKRKFAGKASASPNSNVVASSVPSNGDNNSNNGKASSKIDAGAIAASVAGVGALALVAGLFIYRRRQSSRTVDWQKGELKNSGNTGGPVPPAAAAAAAAVGHRDSTASSQMFSPVSPGERLYSVISTYTPTLGDELEIQPGDKVGILIEYDDGWCQGINHTRGGLKGVFPKHCVDMSSGSSADSSMRLSVGARNSQLGL